MALVPKNQYRSTWYTRCALQEKLYPHGAPIQVTSPYRPPDRYYSAAVLEERAVRLRVHKTVTSARTLDEEALASLVEWTE